MRTADRQAEGYQPDFDLDNAVGATGQMFCSRAIDAILSGETVEIKTDEESWRTGNVYIELECFVSGQWVKSGANTKAFTWAHVIAGNVLVFALKEHVRAVALTYGKPKECRRGNNPTRGRVLPAPQFVAALIGLAKHGNAWARAVPHSRVHSTSADLNDWLEREALTEARVPGYRYRNPARVSPERRAELDRIDHLRGLRAYAAGGDPDDDGGAP